jgi:para-aminobenzoate synthetase/4-amino-4-deoxychorismate lyase
VPSATAPLLTAWVFEHMRPLAHSDVDAFIARRLAMLPPQAVIAGVAGVVPTLDEVAFHAAIRRIRQYITEGDVYQVNFTYALNYRYYGDPLALYARLRQIQPVHYGAFIKTAEQAILSLSPELFMRRTGDRITAKPMKGTALWGLMPAEDAARAELLLTSDKERAENLMIVDLIRNDLGRLAPPGGVRVERLFEIEPYPTVLQMSSTITATVPDCPLPEIFRALFPCGSVSGAPKIRAMEIIAELEHEPRGLYCGALGYLAPDGDFLFNVPIRTLVLEADGRGRLGIGSGVVFDSDPAAEFAECRLKARFLTGLPAQFQLIESLRLDPAHAEFFPFLDRHLRRLEHSARHFGFHWDGGSVRSRLLAHARELGATCVHKTRLLLAQDGKASIASEPLADMPEGATKKVVLAKPRVNSRDLFLYHKTTVRPLHDAELARIAAIAGCFDVLFCNERGELTEGARSNLFLSLGGRLCTPPVSAGLLDGVMRHNLLEQGKAVERTLQPEDLRRADAIYLSNAVRGLTRVQLID